MKIRDIKTQQLINNPAIQIIINDKNVDGRDVKTVDEKVIALGILIEVFA